MELGLMDMFIILTMRWCMYVKAYQIIHFKYVQFIVC